VLVNGLNPLDERKSTTLNFVPWSFLTAAWNHAEDYTVNENARTSSGQANTYSANWAILALAKAKMNYRIAKYERSATAPSGTWEARRSDTNTLTQNINLGLTPLPALTINPVFTLENYWNQTENDPLLDAVIQGIDCGVFYVPTDRFTANLNYNLKVTGTSQVPARHKVLLGGNARYRVFDWGDVYYEQGEEHNEGEVQAGNVFPELDYDKITRTLGINFSVPQSNPIISSIVFNLNYKLVTFDNLLAGRDADDFTASSVNLDGTLNF
jgi:hypothetical protein